jgi:hypothetical protein
MTFLFLPLAYVHPGKEGRTLVSAVDPSFNGIQDHQAALRQADAELCHAIAELQEILERQQVADGELPGGALYSEWVLSLNVIRNALQAVERIAQLLTAASEAQAPG